MNQSIIFSDSQTWDPEKKAVRFQAQESGQLIECIIFTSKLSEFSNIELLDEKQALSLFQQFQFDIEELAEQKIESELFNSEGVIEIN